MKVLQRSRRTSLTLSLTTVFVELESRVFLPLMFFLNLRAFVRCTGITFVDSTMIPACHGLRRYANKVFKGIAKLHYPPTILTFRSHFL